MLLLCIFFSFSESCGAIENLKILQPLLEDLSVVWRQHKRIAKQIKHLDALKSFKLSARLSEIAQLIEACIKTEQVWEVGNDCAKCGRLQDIVSDT